jgi:hypothetical protein
MRRSTKHYLLILLMVTSLNFLVYLFSVENLKNYCKSESQIEPQPHLNLSKNLLSNELKANYLNKKTSNEKICVNKNKYIRFECKKPYCGGWADRLRGLMSAYIWAIFTKRKFLIDVDYPCSLSMMLEPNIVEWNKPIKCYDYDDDDNNKESNSKDIKFTSVRLDKVSNKNFYLMLRNIDIFEYYKEANLITVKNNLDWIYSFSFNKFLNQSIHEFGYKPGNFKLYYFFRKFYNDLFKLTLPLQERYNEFLKEAKPDNETKLICAQIRIGGARPNVAFDVQFTSRNNSKLFWMFIRDSFINVNIKQKYKIFVTTDTESVETEAIDEFGRENVVKIDGPFIHIDREEIGNISDCSRVEKVILDFHAIQNCDIAIISQSGYGRLGIANRVDPTKDLYRFEAIKDKNKHKKGNILDKKFVFNKIENLSML